MTDVSGIVLSRRVSAVPLHAAFVQATNKQIEKLWQGMDWFVCGPIAMTALFMGISIPLMEKRQLANKPGYAEYRRKTRILI